MDEPVDLLNVAFEQKVKLQARKKGSRFVYNLRDLLRKNLCILKMCPGLEKNVAITTASTNHNSQTI